jgi:hypothetical protein
MRALLARFVIAVISNPESRRGYSQHPLAQCQPLRSLHRQVQSGARHVGSALPGFSHEIPKEVRPIVGVLSAMEAEMLRERVDYGYYGRDLMAAYLVDARSMLDPDDVKEHMWRFPQGGGLDTRRQYDQPALHPWGPRRRTSFSQSTSALNFVV